MKISFVITSLVRSGAETVTFRLAKHYADEGHDVEIIMLLYNKIEFDVPSNIKVVNFAGTTNSRVRRITYWLRSLKKHFKERNPDVVISFIARINILTLLSLRKTTAKVIISERNDPRHDTRTKITWFLINRLYPRADYIVFQTEEAKKLFKKKIQQKGVVISNPVKIEKITTLEEYDKNLILYAGRFSEQKDVQTIIRAAERVHQVIPQLRFELYGDGPLKESINQIIKNKHLNNVVYINDNSPDIEKIMRNSWVFLLSSLYEGMSNSLLEASYSGVPCLTTPVLGSSVIEEGKNGFFFNFKDYEKLADLIIDLHQNKNEYSILRKNSIEIAKNRQKINTFDKWMKLIEG